MRMADIDLSVFSISIFAEGQQQYDFYDCHFGFLASKGVIPHDWALASKSYTATHFTAQYTNGLLLTANASGLHISQRWNQETGEKHDLSGLLVKHISAIAPNTFRSAVMVWSAAIPLEDPVKWIKGQFFNTGVISEYLDFSNMAPTFVFESGSLSTDFQFFNRVRIVNEAGDEYEPLLNIMCRVRHSTFTSDTELSAWLLEWRNHEEAMLSKLAILMEAGNGS